ncbi:MAG: SCP2 sterol-binding domain-containing protein [Halioglobus sp.]
MAGDINPTLHTAGLAAAEAALNRALELAPAGTAALAELDDSVFALHCTAPTVDVYLEPQGKSIRLMGIYDGPITTSIRGEASEFAALATASDPAAALINGNLELHGDSAPLIELQRVLSQLDIDWEAPLVGALGDVAGHQLAEMLRGVFSWSKQASASFGRQLEEFIHEEARLSPPRLELEDFYKDVQQLGLRVERLESRTARLRQRLRQRTSR